MSTWVVAFNVVAGVWRAEVYNGNGNLVANLSGSESYVQKLASTMCVRRSVDVGDLLRSPKQAPRGGAKLTLLEGGAP